jgi:hypothetical protein
MHAPIGREPAEARSQWHMPPKGHGLVADEIYEVVQG